MQQAATIKISCRLALPFNVFRISSFSLETISFLFLTCFPVNTAELERLMGVDEVSYSESVNCCPEGWFWRIN
jgi:hypothetical protein